ncbi:type IV pilus modification protein PilV [Metallibacterium sp.]|uniref:type IV pilus modification protein PilV n=1 Tax=Metallibacterium sp. TaxID=2940281 RepID=UPI002632A86D|nr:type IV pilus modification protein PilV [Metallibacterium sp.]
MKRQSFGFTLLEVLVAVVIVSLGMLGVAALLVTVHKADTSSYIQQQAVQTAYDMLDRMRANLQGTQAGYYFGTYTGTPASPPACQGAGNVCTAQQMAAFDTSQWTSSLDELPSGRGAITRPAGPASTNGTIHVTVSVSWSDAPGVQAIEQFKKSGQQQNTGLATMKTFTLTTVM